MASTLHCFAQSGNAYKAALMLELTGEDWQPAFVDFFKGEARSDSYRALNEMAEIPTYQDGNVTLTQSGVILDYLSRKHSQFGPDGPDEEREVLRWLLWDNHKLTANLATGRFMQLYLAPEKRNPDVIAFLMGRAKAAMQVLDRRLETRDFILGPQPTIADLSCAGYVFFLEEVAVDPAATPHLAAWRDRIAALPGWKHPYDLMPGHPRPADAGP
ncbi:MAG: glutathione S-transferase family protein [Pseudomonadota bacterium]